jgi:hypothetical protein
MKLLKKLGLALSALAFCLSLSVATTYAQPGKARYEGNRGKHKGWTKGKHKGWDKNNVGWENRSNRVSDRERNRLDRLNDRLNRTRSRYESDGVLTDWESRRLDRRTTKYNRKANKAGRNW